MDTSDLGSAHLCVLSHDKVSAFLKRTHAMARVQGLEILPECEGDPVMNDGRSVGMCFKAQKRKQGTDDGPGYFLWSGHGMYAGRPVMVLYVSYSHVRFSRVANEDYRFRVVGAPSTADKEQPTKWEFEANSPWMNGLWSVRDSLALPIAASERREDPLTITRPYSSEEAAWETIQRVFNQANLFLRIDPSTL